jgi:hypothetical protein
MIILPIQTRHLLLQHQWGSCDRHLKGKIVLGYEVEGNLKELQRSNMWRHVGRPFIFLKYHSMIREDLASTYYTNNLQ